MKKIFYLLLVFGFVFTACEPLDDINSAIDAQGGQVITGDVEYTLTVADYSTLGLTFGSFNSEDDAKSKIPALLTEMYPHWGKNSSVLVDYKLYIGNAFKLSTYDLKQADYALSGSNLLGFKSDATPENYLGGIITSKISSPKEGDYALAKYYQYTGSAFVVTPTVSLKDNFDYGATAGNLTAVSSNWTAHSGAGSGPVGYAATGLTMANYPSSNVGGSITIGSGSEDVNSVIPSIINSGKVYSSALINLSAVSTGTYFFHFMDDTFGYSARVGAQDNGSGKISFGIGASSSTLTFGSTAYDLNTTYLLVASYDIASGVSNLYVLATATATEPTAPEATNTGNSGLTIQKIAIRQGGGGPTATIDGVRVANSWSSIMSDATLADEVIGAKNAKETFYTYAGGAWKIPSANFYSLTEADFASMGLTNFGSSTPPDNYLITFLGVKFPYAQDGDKLNVMYNYVSSSSGAQTRGNLYTYNAGVWVAYQSTISTTLQFGNDGTIWVPDNTIKYTLVADDYAYIATTLSGNAFFANVSLTNLANYKDYDYNWSDAQILYSLDVLLNHLNPSAAEGQKYFITYLLYDNGTNNVSRHLIKTNGKWIWNV